MKRWKLRLGLGFTAVLALALGIALLVPNSRYFLLGIVRGETFELGQPTSYWIDAMRAEDPEKRYRAVVALGNIGPEAQDAIPGLARELKDPTELIRINAALSLMKIGPADPSPVLALAEALQDDLAQVRINAVIVLNQMGPKARGAVPALIKALQDRQNLREVPRIGRSVGQVAATALGRIGPDAREAIPVLTEVLAAKESDPDLRERAADALKKIGPQS